MRPVGDDREDGGASGDPSERPKRAPWIQHERTRHQPGRNDGCRNAAHQVDMTHEGAGLRDVQPVGSQQEGRREPDQTPSPQGTDAASHDDVERGPLTPQERKRLWERGFTDGSDGVESSAPGLADGEEHERAQQHARHAEREERSAPPMRLGDCASRIRAEVRADRRAESEYAERHETSFSGKAVRHNRGRRRRRPRFTHPHTNASQHELQGGQGQTAGHREPGPENQGGGHDVAAIGAVGEPSNGEAATDVEQGERHAGHERRARVG